MTLTTDDYVKYYLAHPDMLKAFIETAQAEYDKVSEEVAKNNSLNNLSVPARRWAELAAWVATEKIEGNSNKNFFGQYNQNGFNFQHWQAYEETISKVLDVMCDIELKFPMK